MNIAYACNEAYIEQTTVSIVSLLENNQSVDEIVVYFVDMGTTEDSRKDLYKTVSSYNRVLKVILFEQIAYDLSITDTGRHIASVYAKIFFGRIENIDRILYIDSDTVIVDSLYEFYNMDISKVYCAAVETIHCIKDNEIIGLKAEDKAINDGVVLMNLDLWRSDNMLEKCKRFIAEWNGNPPVLSEGTINAVCKDKIQIVNPRYNLCSGFVGVTSKRIQGVTGRSFYSQKELEYANRHPVIIHFLSGIFNRPWCKKCTHPMKNEYFKYRNLTKWKNEPLSDTELSIRTKLIGFISKNFPDWLYIFLYRHFGSR